MYTWSCRILAQVFISEKCSTSVSFRSMSANQMAISSCCLSKSSRWITKCYEKDRHTDSTTGLSQTTYCFLYYSQCVIPDKKWVLIFMDMSRSEMVQKWLAARMLNRNMQQNLEVNSGTFSRRHTVSRVVLSLSQRCPHSLVISISLVFIKPLNSPNSM